MACLSFYLSSFQNSELVPRHLQKFNNYVRFESIVILTLIKAQIVPCREVSLNCFLCSFGIILVVFDVSHAPCYVKIL